MKTFLVALSIGALCAGCGPDSDRCAHGRCSGEGHDDSTGIVVCSNVDHSVDMDLLSMTESVRTECLDRLVRFPQSMTGKTVRVSGIAFSEPDDRGQVHYGVEIYSQGGCCCCPVGMIEYFPVAGTVHPKEDATIVLSGTVDIPAREAYSHFTFTNAAVREVCPLHNDL